MGASYLVTQIPSVVNDAYEDVMGMTSGTQNIETTDIVSMGKALSSFDLLDKWYGSLTNRIVKTVIWARRYSADTRKILRDEHTWGAFIQKIYVHANEAVNNPAFTNAPSSNSRTQNSPYGVTSTLSVETMLFGGEGTWAHEFQMPSIQIAKAFLSEEAMNAFVDGQFIAILNRLEVEKEALINSACNTGIADCLANGKCRNLLAEYNTKFSASLTVDSCQVSKDFLKWATKEINKTVTFLGKPSVNFNVAGYEINTPKDKLIVEVLTEFAQACEYYLESDTYHNNLVQLPNYTEVPFWQSQGLSQSFADCSKIDVKHNDISEGDPIIQGGIVAMLRDEDYCAAYFGDEYQWSQPNVRDRVSIYGYEYKKGYAIERHANAIVFYIADGGTVTLTDSSHITLAKSPSTASAGVKITITPTITSGYHVKKMEVTMANGKKIDITDSVDSSGKYYFTPNDNENITIKVTEEAD